MATQEEILELVRKILFREIRFQKVWSESRSHSLCW